MLRNHRSVTALQAAHESPILTHLAQLASESTARFKCIEGLLPKALIKCIKAGPINGSEWCLISENNSAAAKLRQLAPALQAHLRTKGYGVSSIRVKVNLSSSLT